MNADNIRATRREIIEIAFGFGPIPVVAHGKFIDSVIVAPGDKTLAGSREHETILIRGDAHALHRCSTSRNCNV